jgi:hypothetical protein
MSADLSDLLKSWGGALAGLFAAGVAWGDSRRSITEHTREIASLGEGQKRLEEKLDRNHNELVKLIVGLASKTP